VPRSKASSRKDFCIARGLCVSEEPGELVAALFRAINPRGIIKKIYGTDVDVSIAMLEVRRIARGDLAFGCHAQVLANRLEA
jgi:hypothetical protein